MRCNKCGVATDETSYTALKGEGWIVLGWERGALVGLCKKDREKHEKGVSLNANACAWPQSV